MAATTNDPQDRDQLIEALAAEEHGRWGDWQGYQHSRGKPEEYHERDGEVRTGLLIRADDWQHWERLIATPYAELPPYSQQSDRDQVKRYWPIWVNYVTDWLIDAGLDDAAQDWQREMEWPEGNEEGVL